VRALLREVVTDPHLRETASTLESLAQELVWTIGALQVALVISATSATSAVLLLGVVCIGRASLFARSPLARDHPIRGPRRPRSTALANAGCGYCSGQSH
jgi:hypothetical protein